MKAFVLSGFDEPPILREVDGLSPGPGEVLVRVGATSVNPVDAMVRAGFFRQAQEYRFPAVFGRDYAGTVEQLGSGVTHFAPSDRVFGFVKRAHIGDGTFAEYVVVPQDMFIVAAPRRTTLQQAGVLGLSGVTALECVDAVPAGPGDVVVVNGATGGVGTFAVQIAAAQGAEVIATARTEEQRTLLSGLGAKHTVDWKAGDLVEQVRALVPDGVDGLLDFVKHVDSAVMGVGEDEAHAEFARLCTGVLRPGGRAASLTNGGDPALIDENTFTNVHSTPSTGTLARLAALVESGAVTPVIAATFAFDDIDAAFDRLGSAQPGAGKISVVLEAAE